jgi:hypothetical protein
MRPPVEVPLELVPAVAPRVLPSLEMVAPLVPGPVELAVDEMPEAELRLATEPLREPAEAELAFPGPASVGPSVVGEPHATAVNRRMESFFMVTSQARSIPHPVFARYAQCVNQTGD